MDFNGVIINDEPLQMQAYQELLKGEGIELGEAEYYECMGMNDDRFLSAAYHRAGREPDANKFAALKTAKTNRWRDLIADEIPLFDGVENFIRKMEKDFTLGIVSMARREEIEYVLENTGLRDAFMIVVAAEDVTECKPHHECYHHGFALIDAARTARGRNPITHYECLAIEDSPAGIAAAKAADLQTLGVTNTVSAAELRAAGADATAKNLNDWMPETINLVFERYAANGERIR